MNNIIPLEFSIENFVSIKKAHIDCTQFDSALILGKEKGNDGVSNGVGKTNILRALMWLITGKVDVSNLNYIIMEGEKKVSGWFVFELNGVKYKIIRSKTASGSSKAELEHFIEDKWVGRSERSPSETSEEIAKLIKLSYNSLKYMIYFMQTELSEVGLATAKNPEQRMSILREPLELGDYKKLFKIISDKTKAISYEVDVTEESIKILGDPKTGLKSAKEDLKKCSATIKDISSDIESLKSSIKEKKSTLDQLKASISSDDINIHNNISDAENTFTSLNKKLQSEKSENDGFKNKIKKNEELLKLDEEKLTNTSDEYNQVILIKGSPIKELESELERISADEERGKGLLIKFRHELVSAKKTIPKGDKCQSCFQYITEDHRAKCEAKGNELVSELNAKIKKTEENLVKCGRAKARVQEKIKISKDIENKKKDLKHSIEVLENKVSSNKETISSLKISLDKSDIKLKEIKKEIEGITSKLDSLKVVSINTTSAELNKQIIKISEDIRKLDSELESKSKTYSSEMSNEGGLRQKISQYEDNIAKLEPLKVELVEKKRRLRIHKKVKEGFSPSGIPLFIVHNVINDLQIEANKWLAKMRPSLRIQFKKDLSVEFYENNSLRQYELISGGQKIYLAFALKVGYTKIIQKTAGISVDLLALDEVDALLDKDGKTALIEIIRKLKREYKVFMITHDDRMKEEFSKAILVERDNGQSTGTLVSNW